MLTWFLNSKGLPATAARIIALPVALPLIVVGQLLTTSLNGDAGTLGQAISEYIRAK